MASVEARTAPMQVLVVDDEELARSNLTVLLRRDPDVGAITECTSGSEAIAVIRQAKPHLVFLDVQMPECAGFDVLEMLGSDLPPAIIFVTAHDEYALRAFEAGALDYLLKPFDDARFRRALQRAKDRLAHSPLGQLTDREREVLSLMAQGMNNASIAKALFLTDRAVEKHINSMFHKLGLTEEPDVHRRVMAVLAFLRETELA